MPFIEKVTWNDLMNVKMIFLSIIIEALPFILVGVFISALINQLVSEQLIARLLPKNKLYSILPACFIGVLFPVCDCGIVPIARRLIKKGVPLPAAVAFMLTAPIVNPVVASATSFAFNSPAIMWLRLGMALLVAICTALCLGNIFRSPELRSQAALQDYEHPCGCNHGADCQSSWYNRCLNVLSDSCNEFFEMGRYLIFGALLSSIAQTFIPHTIMTSVGQDPTLSIAVMMVFAFFVSICSTSDAFIAASFSGSFTIASLLSFMTFGPMIDLKNTFMLCHTFRPRLVLTLVLLTSLLCFISAYLLHILLQGVLL
ncbi:MAG: Protein of unknown function transrane [Sporomusa sp.]|nr:Protein of unknown function transrane [Sporomusa sp.]